MSQTSKKIPIMCLTLDNVIIKGDSLLRLSSFLKGYGLRHGKLGLMKRIYSLCHRRYNQDISQRRFKFELIRSLRKLKKPQLAEEFAQKLADSMKPSVRERISRFKDEGGKVVLVTAAPSEYAAPLARIIGAEHCISTPSFSEFRRLYPLDPIDYEECHGIEKSERLLKWIEQNDYSLHTVVGGEPDDFYLLTLPEIDSRFVTSSAKPLLRSLRRKMVFFETF